MLYFAFSRFVILAHNICAPRTTFTRWKRLFNLFFRTARSILVKIKQIFLVKLDGKCHLPSCNNER